MRVLTVSALYFFFQVLTAKAQISEEWMQVYNGRANGPDWSHCMCTDANGYIYVAGRTGGLQNNFYDYFTIKYSRSGELQWIRLYNGPLNRWDEAHAITADSSGNVYVTGSSEVNRLGDFATIKYNSEGGQLWVQYFTGNTASYAGGQAIAIDRKRNVYVTGGTGAGNPGSTDFATIKYNPDGEREWVQFYDGPNHLEDSPTAIAVDDSCNVYVTGRSNVAGWSLYDYVTVKYSSSGVQQWVQRYDGPSSGEDAAYSLALDSYSNVYVTGRSDSAGTLFDIATIKYNSAGGQVWVRRYNGPVNGRDIGRKIVVDGFSNVYITGQSDNEFSYSDYITIKYDASGNLKWTGRYNFQGNGGNVGRSIAVDGSGNVYVTGSSWRNGSRYDYATIMYSEAGVQQWVRRFNGPGNSDDIAYAIVVDHSGFPYISGESYTGGISGTDCVTFKYSPITGIKQTSGTIPKKFSLFQNYPNPFNSVTKIRFDIPTPLNPPEGGKFGFVTLKIYDVLGREAATLVNEPLEPGTYEVEWPACRSSGAGRDANDYPSGVYFYKFFGDDYQQTKKLVLIK